MFLPGESHRQRSLKGYSPRGHGESGRTEQLSTATTRSPKEGGWPLEQPIIFLEGHNFQSHPRPPGGERDRRLSLTTNDFTNHARIMKLQLKRTGSRELLGWGAGGDLQRTACSESMDAPCPLAAPCPMHLFHLFLSYIHS